MVTSLLNRMQLTADYYVSDEGKCNISVSVPPTRSDILHACDAVEDVAIAYGYINIQMPMPKLHQPVKPLPLNEFSDLLSDEITRMGQKKNDELKSVAKARGES